ncbi:nitrile hydratase subunit beta [Pantoea vagans]|uniref:nitrile hydratase subunit beta n=1 Tax=Pantoea vagans TaxID=470934 RepID=UPI00301B2B24
MNGIHDLGGMHGMGAVITEENEPPFHHEWERRTFSLFASLFVGGHFNVDMFRHAIECMNPAHYLEESYYEHWMHAFETLLLEKGVITPEELAGIQQPGEASADIPVLRQEMVQAVIMTGASARVNTDMPASFRAGDRVRAKNINPAGHTRLPRYVRGKTGTIVIDHGIFITPDTVAHGLGDHPQHVYSVSFDATELWGKNAAAKDTVRIDLWDDYLEAL